MTTSVLARRAASVNKLAANFGRDPKLPGPVDAHAGQRSHLLFGEPRLFAKQRALEIPALGSTMHFPNVAHPALIQTSDQLRCKPSLTLAKPSGG